MKKQVTKNENQEEKQNLILVNQTWYLRAMVNGVIVKQSLHTSNLAEARILRDERLASLKSAKDEKTMLQSVQRQLDGISIEEERRRKEENQGEVFSTMWKRFESSPARDVVPEVMNTYRRHWNVFIEWLQENHPLVLRSHQVDRSIAQEYADHLWNDMKMTPANYNKYVATAKMVFNDSMDRDDDLNNPFSRIKKAVVKTNRHEIFTEEELELMKADSDKEFVRFCAIGLYTTQRINRAKSIQWEWFSPDLKQLYINHNKTEADGSMIVPAELIAVLERVPPDERHGFVCPTWAKMHKAVACLKFREKLVSLGIVAQAENTGRGKRKICVHGYHSFRHTGITRSLQNGASSAEVKRLSGQRTTAMQEHYTHMGMEDAGRAASKIGFSF